MSELKELIEELKIDIDNLEMDLITKKNDVDWLIKAKTVENKELYNGLINNLKTSIKEVTRTNNFYGHTQSDTEQYYHEKIAYIESGDVFFTKEQKQIILDYHKRENKVVHIVITGKPYYS